MELTWRNKWLRWLIFAGISVMLVASVAEMDSLRQARNSKALGLRWARQIAIQAESIALAASESGEKDPLAWTARLLSQGTDSRIIYASKFHSPAFQQASTDSVEDFDFDPSTGILDYKKILEPQTSDGIRIQLYVTRTLIFGAKSLFTQDLTFATLFLLCFCLFSFAFHPAPKPEPRRQPEPAAEPHPNLDTKIDDWIISAKSALVDLGAHIREMTRAAQKLSTNAVSGHEELLEIQKTLQMALSDATKKNSGEMTTLASDTEALFKTADTRTKALMRRLLLMAITKASRTAVLEKQLDGALSHCDRALEFMLSTQASAREMSAEITQTTTGMLDQSKRMAELKKRA